MPTVALTNLGCKVNQYETERMAESFESHGFTLTDFRAPADVYVINTCSVTADADKKSRNIARRAARTNPDARVVLTGCFAQMAMDTAEQVDGASLLVPNSEKMRTVQHVYDAFPHLFQYTSSPASLADTAGTIAVFPEAGPSNFVPISSLMHGTKALHRTRGTLNIQDGCRYFCSFCSIPYTRNVMASRPLPAILEEAMAMAAQGTSEIVVTGVCVGAYGPETGSGGARLADVLLQVANIPGVERVRLSSVQPVEVSDDVIDAMANHPNVAHHLHLSMQSGHDTILTAMNRPYDTAFFASHVAKLRQSIPDIGLTTDIIVGFPGETTEIFDESVAFVRKMQFARAHVFRYSPRQRTAAASLRDDVPPDVKEARHRAMTQVCLASQKEFASQFVGQQVTVLVEASGMRDEWLSGYTGNYIRVQFESTKSMRGKLVRVDLTDILPEGDAYGILVRD